MQINPPADYLEEVLLVLRKLKNIRRFKNVFLKRFKVSTSRERERN